MGICFNLLDDLKKSLTVPRTDLTVKIIKIARDDSSAIVNKFE